MKDDEGTFSIVPWLKRVWMIEDLSSELLTERAALSSITFLSKIFSIFILYIYYYAKGTENKTIQHLLNGNIN